MKAIKHLSDALKHLMTAREVLGLKTSTPQRIPGTSLARHVIPDIAQVEHTIQALTLHEMPFLKIPLETIQDLNLFTAFDIEEMNLAGAFDIEESSEDPNDWGRPSGPNRSDSVIGPNDGNDNGGSQSGFPPISPMLNLNKILSTGGIHLGAFIGFEGDPSINPLI